MPFGRQAQAVAYGAEMIAQCRDKPDFTFSAVQNEPLSRAVKRV